MDVQYIELEKISANQKKMRKNHNITGIAESIRQNGWTQPVVVDELNRVLVGTGRLLAARKLKLDKIPVVIKTGLTEAQKQALALIDNRLTDQTEWDFEAITSFLDSTDFDFTPFELNLEEWIPRTQYDEYETHSNVLREKFGIPPFSILDSRNGEWQKRKDIWQKILKSGNGRKDDAIGGGGLGTLAEKHGANLTGTSIFDPVLCETLIQWFCPPGGKVLDPFAGGSVRGMVSTLLGREYDGYDISLNQCEENRKTASQFENAENLLGKPFAMPNWINEDARNIDGNEEYDFVLSCPPYADLERYSDDPKDLSTLPYDEFKTAYGEIIAKSAKRLKNDSFAVFVVGEVRDKKGIYYNFVSDTIEAFIHSGMQYYNEMILVNICGTLALRAGKQFSASRKLGKCHQNGLCFVKGDPRKATQRLRDVENVKFDEFDSTR